MVQALIFDVFGTCVDWRRAIARAAGVKTAFVPRPDEYGPGQRTDLAPAADWDMIATNFQELAGRL